MGSIRLRCERERRLSIFLRLFEPYSGHPMLFMEQNVKTYGKVDSIPAESCSRWSPVRREERAPRPTDVERREQQSGYYNYHCKVWRLGPEERAKIKGNGDLGGGPGVGMENWM